MQVKLMKQKAKVLKFFRLSVSDKMVGHWESDRDKKIGKGSF